MGKQKREVRVKREQVNVKSETNTPKFYTFNQNNSGGRSINDENVADYVVIEAFDVDDANTRAQGVGIYFNGCDDELDCKCCGDRWYAQSTWGKDPGTEKPMVYDKTVEDFLATDMWRDDARAIVYYLDGTRETYETIEKDD